MPYSDPDEQRRAGRESKRRRRAASKPAKATSTGKNVAPFVEPTGRGRQLLRTVADVLNVLESATQDVHDDRRVDVVSRSRIAISAARVAAQVLVGVELERRIAAVEHVIAEGRAVAP